MMQKDLLDFKIYGSSFVQALLKSFDKAISFSNSLQSFIQMFEVYVGEHKSFL